MAILMTQYTVVTVPASASSTADSFLTNHHLITLLYVTM